MDADLRTVLSAWSVPKTGEYMNPFSISSGIGLIQIGSLPINAFRLTPPNIVPLFYSDWNSVGITLRFDPVLGRFSGGYPDKSLGSPVWKTFEGVCIQNSPIIRGMSVRSGSSEFVGMAPYVE